MNVEIIAIGDEILLGQILDSNSHWIARKMAEIGTPVKYFSVISDKEDVIHEAFAVAYRRSDVVLITGGLGPTDDDRTKGILAKFFNLPLTFRNDILIQVKEHYKNSQLKFSDTSREQAEFPAGATAIKNSHGTAPGIWIEREGHFFIAMPGVPSEMMGMMNDFVIPKIVAKQYGPITLFRTLNTYGIIEASLYEKLDNRREIREYVGLAFLPSFNGVKLRITAEGKDKPHLEARLDRAESLIREKIEKYIVGVGENLSLEKTVGEKLLDLRNKLAVAESCTAGFLSKRLTDISGSSGFFERGFVTYSNEAKNEMLGVPMDLIERHGAVSSEVAEAMAKGVLKNSRADVAISITGVAGPTGGTEEKPVGLVYIGYADSSRCIHKKCTFGKNRTINRDRSVSTALMLLLNQLQKQDDDFELILT
jgi:competence/damage-inducible protein CinA-like protein